MNPNPPSPEARPWLPKDQLRFALLLAGVAIVLVILVLNRRSPALELAREVKRIEEQVRDRHRTNALRAVRSACRRTDCACAATAAGAGLDVDAGKLVLDLLDHAETCPKLDGMRAEALVRSGATDAGLRIAQRAHGTPHAACANALGFYARGNLPVAAAAARQAIDAKRGDGAQLLLGLVNYAQGDFDGARRAFTAVRKSEPDDVDASYNLGTVAQKQNRYGEARQLYLTTLRLNPKYKLARYNLGLLAHSIGAEAEAQHHLEKLRAIAPVDPLVPSLERALATAPANRPTHVLKLGAAPAPAASR
jgi:tetratricopeptide (TPR) repeat protein